MPPRRVPLNELKITAPWLFLGQSSAREQPVQIDERARVRVHEKKKRKSQEIEIIDRRAPKIDRRVTKRVCNGAFHRAIIRFWIAISQTLDALNYRSCKHFLSRGDYHF